MIGQYNTEADKIAVISGKLACSKKQIALCHSQLTSAASKWNLKWKIMDIEGHSIADVNEDGSDDNSKNEDSPVVPDNVPDD